MMCIFHLFPLLAIYSKVAENMTPGTLITNANLRQIFLNFIQVWFFVVVLFFLFCFCLFVSEFCLSS
jgi:hypothetical protein